MRKLLVLLGAASIGLLAAASPAWADGEFQCNGTFVGVTVGDVVVPPKGACTLTLSTVKGNVTVLKKASFEAIFTKIGANVEGQGDLVSGDADRSDPEIEPGWLGEIQQRQRRQHEQRARRVERVLAARLGVSEEPITLQVEVDSVDRAERECGEQRNEADEKDAIHDCTLRTRSSVLAE